MYNNLRLVYITTSSKEEARTIGRHLVEHRLATCVNIIPGMESIYYWEDELQIDQECVLIAKTHYSKVKLLTNKVVEMHSYDCPCVVSLTITEDEGHKPYLNWLIDGSKDMA